LAIAAYKNVLEDFQAKEIYNNLGVAYALESLRYREKGDLEFIYPIEIDVRSSLKPEFGYGQKSPEEIRCLLLSNAFNNFNQAIILDPSYAPAKLNKACVLTMDSGIDLTDPVNQIFLQEVKTRNLYQEYTLLEGIRAGLDGQKTIARQKFMEVLSSNRTGSIKELAQLNLDILEGQSTNSNEMFCGTFKSTDFPDLTEHPDNKIFSVLDAYKQKECIIEYRKDYFGNVEIYGEVIGEKNSDVLIQVTSARFLTFGEDKIRVGMSKEQLKEYICKPVIAETNDGHFYLIGDEERYLFEIAESTNLISSWGRIN